MSRLIDSDADRRMDLLLAEAGAKWQANFAERPRAAVEFDARPTSLDPAPTEIAPVPLPARRRRWVAPLLIAAATAVVVGSVALVSVTGNESVGTSSDDPDQQFGLCGTVPVVDDGIQLTQGATDADGALRVSVMVPETTELLQVRVVGLDARGRIATYWDSGVTVDPSEGYSFIVNEVIPGRSFDTVATPTTDACEGAKAAREKHVVVFVMRDGGVTAIDGGPLLT